MNKPSPAFILAVAVVPNARVIVRVPAPAIAVTKKFSPVLEFLTTSPTVNIYAEEDPAPVTVRAVPVVIAAATLAYLPP
jgi:hypothetical protein